MTLRRRIGNHCLSDVLFSVRTARYTTYRMGGKLAVRPFDLCLQNDSICERVCPWRLVRTRWSCESGCDQADALTNLLKVLCNTSLIDLFCVHISSYFDLVTCIAFKFCCILLHAVLTTNKDHTPSQFQTTDWCWSKAVPSHLKSRQDALSKSIL